MYPTSSNHLKHWPTEPNREKHHQIAKLPNVLFFDRRFKALEISKPTKGIALVQVSAKVIRCDFSAFLDKASRWSNDPTEKWEEYTWQD